MKTRHIIIETLKSIDKDNQELSHEKCSKLIPLNFAGYFRECDIIAHSKDVDIGIFASSYSDKIITVMQNYGFQLKISLGFPNDSFELSFLDHSGLKLDIFFFYEEGQSYWNGGTQVKSGKKFK